MRLGALAPLGLGRRVGREAVAAAAQLEHVRPAVGRDERPRDGLDGPSSTISHVEPGRVQRDRVGRAEHDDAVRDGRAARSACGRSRAAARTRRPPRPCRSSTRTRRTRPYGIAAVEVVAHDQAGPARLERERALDVALRGRRALVRRAHGSDPPAWPPTSSAKSGALSGRGWHIHVMRASGVTSATVLPSESIAWRSIGTAFAPASQSRRVSSEAREQAGDVLRVVHAQLGERLARADLDAEVGAGEAAERVLVGDVVADEDGRGGADLVADRIEREALVGLDDGELDHALALARVHAGQRRRAVAHGRQRGLPVLLGGLAVVQRRTRRLVLDGDTRPGSGDRVQLLGDAIAQLDAPRGRARERSRRRTRCRGCRRGGSPRAAARARRDRAASGPR